MKLNFWKKKPKGDADSNQRILDNIREFIEKQKEINTPLISKGGVQGQQAVFKIDFIRELYKKMNS